MRDSARRQSALESVEGAAGTTFSVLRTCSKRRLVFVVATLLALGGCSNSAAAPDVFASELGPPVDVSVGDGAAPFVLDFVVQGCGQRTEDRCRGQAPLVLTFSLVTSAPQLPLGKWSFGDGGEASGASATHVFTKPGKYTVTVAVGHLGGTRAETKTDFVVVEPVAAGGPCQSDASCTSGRCVCGDGKCLPPLNAGLCLAACGAAACGSEEVCVQLGTTGSAAVEPWRTAGCFPSCNGSGDCARPSFACRAAPTASGATASGSWQRACLPPFPGGMGASCRQPSGAFSNDACLGRLCLEFGAAGACSAACQPGGCPEGSRCVEFASALGKGAPLRVCLRRCAPGGGCAGDPALGCEAPGGAGSFGFRVVGPLDPTGTTYCSARSCSKRADCGLGAGCSGGYCSLP